jgi:sugar-phosphatase
MRAGSITRTTARGGPVAILGGMPDAIRLPCRGVLFDCDGVLVDSDISVARSWKRWAEAYGLRPEEVAEMVHGRRSQDTVGLLIAEPDRSEALATIDRYEVEDARIVTAIPGARELLSGMPDAAWAIVTSGVTPLARARLAAAGLPVPGVLVTADDVTAGKPAPDGFRAAAGALRLAPSDTVVLEDSPAGVEAARAAGVGAVLGVGERALETDADVVVPDLRAVRWTADGLAIRAEDALRG